MNQTNKLSLEEQDKLVEQLSKQDGGSTLLTQAVLQGIIDPPNVRHLRNAVKAFVTKDPDTQRMKERCIKLSTFDDPVLIIGESGTGKELLARILHGERKGFFTALNVCAITDTLFESELFGHVRGSFTGADKDREGLIKAAEGGTLFLDEIGDMSPHIQSKLLRVLNERVYRKVGSNFNEQVKCRIVAATHRNLAMMIASGEFRLDLFERLQVFKLRIKPLRERKEDLVLYTGEEFLKRLKWILNGTDFQWSGNVRQVLNLKRRWEVFGDEEITKEDVL